MLRRMLDSWLISSFELCFPFHLMFLRCLAPLACAPPLFVVYCNAESSCAEKAPGDPIMVYWVVKLFYTCQQDVCQFLCEHVLSIVFCQHRYAVHALSSCAWQHAARQTLASATRNRILSTFGRTVILAAGSLGQPWLSSEGGLYWCSIAKKNVGQLAN